MKIKEGFMLREIADSWVVVPVGKRVVEFNGLISLSESGALLWQKLENGAAEEDLLKSMLHEYEIEEDAALADIRDFIRTLDEKGLFE
ncbi:MAG: PqqD family protein [Clostridia bacterium]|nr:PqqD family protein [Clostridia bacterium]